MIFDKELSHEHEGYNHPRLETLLSLMQENSSFGPPRPCPEPEMLSTTPFMLNNPSSWTSTALVHYY